MTGYPAFGVLLARLMDHHGFDAGSLSKAAGVAESEIGGVLDGTPPSPPLLRSLAPALGLRTPDLFVIATVPVPEDLAPLDPEAGAIVKGLVWDVTHLPPDERSHILQLARSLPQEARTQPPADAQVLARFEPTFGAVLVAMLRDNRNLPTWGHTTMVISALTDFRMCLSSVTVIQIAGMPRMQKPKWLAGLATTLGIPIRDISALTGIDLPDDPVDPAVAGLADLLWEARRLTAYQVRSLRSHARALSS